MKNLFNWAQDIYHDVNIAGNSLYFTERPGDTGPNNSAQIEQEENVEKKIDKAMRSPLGFGVKELRFLEEHESEMTGFQKKRFRNIAGYQISLTQGKDMEDLPPRMLTHLADSSLIKLLSKRMQDQIISGIDTQMKSLEKIVSKNADNWSTTELSKVCVLYRRLRKNAVYENGSRDGVFEDARKKIIEKSFALMTKSITKSDKVYDIVENKDNKVMTLEEKLLVVEIRKMFPNEKSWAEKSKFYDWDKIAVDSIVSIFKDKETNKLFLTDPNKAFTWELLRDFVGTNSGISSAGTIQAQILSKITQEDLDKAFMTTEAIKFLQFAKNSRVFLPTHLQALQQILNTKEEGGIEIQKLEDIKPWEEYTEEKKDLRKLEKKLRELKEKNLKVEQNGLEKYFKLSKTDQARIDQDGEWKKTGIVDTDQIDVLEAEYNSRKLEKEAFINDNWENNFSGWIDLGKTAWESVKDRKIKDLELQKAKELSKTKDLPEADRDGYKSTIESNYGEKIQEAEGFSAKLEAFKTSIPTVTNPDDRKKKIEEFSDTLHENGSEIQKIAEYKEFNTKHGEYNKVLRQREEKQIDVAKKVPIVSSADEERKKLEKDSAEIQKKITEKTKELDIYKSWGELLKNPEKVAERARDGFIDNLAKRAADNNLYAADFEVLWGEEFLDPNNPYYGELGKFREKLNGIPNRDKIEEFREKFHDILGGIFDEVELSQLSDGDDKFAPWYRELNDALSYDNIISRLKEEGFDLREKFQSPQQITQLIDGAIQSYRDGIFKVVRDNIDELTPDEEREFYAGWDRLHGGLEGMTDPTKIHQKHIAYEQSKLKTSENIENAHQVNQAYVEGLLKKSKEATDPVKKEHYWNEAKKLERSFEYRKAAYQTGGNFWGKDAEGNDKQYWAPGKELLNELDIQTQSVAKEISSITNELRDNIAGIADSFQGILQIEDPVEKRLREAQVRDKMEKLLGKWPGIRDSLQGKINDMGTIMLEVIPDEVAPDDFINVILKRPNAMLKSFGENFKELESRAREKKFKFTGKEAFWKVFADNFITFENALNFQSGDMAKEGNKLDKYLEDSNNTLEFLTEIQFFDDNTPEKDEFTKNYKTYADEFKSNFAKYQEAVNDIAKRLRRDINKCEGKADDSKEVQEFFRKYGIDPEYMKGVLAGHTARSEEFKGMSEKFLQPNFIKDWIHRYDSSPQDRVEAIAEMGDFRGLKDHSKDAKDYAKKMQAWVAQYDDNNKIKGQKVYQRFSLYDLYAIVKQAIEVHERRWQRDSDRAVAEIGKSFFGEKSAWGKEFKQKSEESEENRVKEFETQYGEVAGWDLQEALYKANDPDEAKALIRLLLEKGFMQWDDPSFWKTLERLSNGAVKFRDEDINLSRLEIRDKVRDACEFIWSPETFREWDTSFEGKLKSAIDGHNADFDRYEDDPGARTRIMANMLKQWKRGDSTNVDPARFECFIDQSFEKGKMNGQPDERWYFMVMGISTINPKTGRSLISRDVFMRMNSKHLARFPHIDFLTDKESPKLKGRIVPKGTPGARIDTGWTFEDYQEWGKFMTNGNGSFDIGNDDFIREQTEKFFYHIVHASPSARDRVVRMDRFADKEGDHDDAQSFFAEWDQTKVATHLSKDSGGENKSSDDFWRRYLSGFEPYMKYMNEYIIEGDGLYGNEATWKTEKNRALLEVGDRLKAALTVTQTLQGNGIKGESRGSLVFTSEKWRKEETGYSASAQKSKDQINGFMRDIFADTDGGKDVEGILDYMGADEFGIDWKGREKKLKDSGTTDKFNKLIDGKKTREIYFENVTTIEKVLKNWRGGDSGKLINMNFD